LDLLLRLEAIDDCVERNVLLFKIHRLKQYREPKKPKKQRTVNHSKDIIKEIENYRNAVKYKGRTSYLEKHIGTLTEEDKMLSIKHFDVNTMYINIIPFNNLKDVVKVSDRTISRWAKKGFINPQCNPAKRSHFVYVDLLEIKQHIIR